MTKEDEDLFIFYTSHTCGAEKEKCVQKDDYMPARGDNFDIKKCIKYCNIPQYFWGIRNYKNIKFQKYLANLKDKKVEEHN